MNYYISYIRNRRRIKVARSPHIVCGKEDAVDVSRLDTKCVHYDCCVIFSSETRPHNCVQFTIRTYSAVWRSNGLLGHGAPGFAKFLHHSIWIVSFMSGTRRLRQGTSRNFMRLHTGSHSSLHHQSASLLCTRITRV